MLRGDQRLWRCVEDQHVERVLLPSIMLGPADASCVVREESTSMNMIMKAGVLATLVTLAACGAENATKSGTSENAATAGAAPAASASESHSGTGTVKSISGSDVTIAHEEIKSIGWPAMEMTFTAADPALANGINAGDRVSFAFTKGDGATTLTSISKQ